jgi:hypothetical protein
MPSLENAGLAGLIISVALFILLQLFFRAGEGKVSMTLRGTLFVFPRSMVIRSLILVLVFALVAVVGLLFPEPNIGNRIAVFGGGGLVGQFAVLVTSFLCFT